MIPIILVMVSMALGDPGDDHRPDWVRDHPLGYKHRFIVGSSYADDYATARSKAYQNALQHLLEENGIHVDPVVSSIEQTNNHVEARSTLRYRTKSMTIDSLRVVAEYQHAEIVATGVSRGAKTIYECHLLLRCLRKDPQSKPWPVTLALGSLVLPGSSHIRIGVNTRGRWILWRSSLILLGALASWYMADEFRNHDSDIGEQSRKLAIVLSLGYGLFGIGSTYDVLNSRYLVEYD